MRIGVLPLGYADGIPRALGNNGAVLVDGARCPIIGRVAMNMCIVDLSHARNAQGGTKVTLIGRDGQRSKILLALGPLLRGTLWETVAVPELRSQARRVAETLLEQTPLPEISPEEVMMEYMI